MKISSYAFGASIFVLAVASTAHAQAGTSAAAAAAVPDAATGAGEIIVTANKREQNLNKVGLSITAFGSEQLANRRVSNISDLATITPGLTFAPTPTANPVYTLRGVGFFESTLAAYPDVSIYLDQAPLSLPVMSTLTAFDLERVEVLKGPQGTLFGNNATGGAINFIAAKPTSKPQGGMEFGYGRFNTLTASGFFSGPITDTLRARVAFKSVHSADGWQRSYSRDDDLGQENNFAGRLIVDWTPTSRLKFSLNINGWNNKNDPQAPQKIANSLQNPLPANSPEPLFPIAPHNDRAADWGPNRPFADTSFEQATLRSDYDLGFGTLTSITGYSHTDFHNATEGGGTPYADLDIVSDKARIKSFTQELRLANNSANRIRWVLGGNYERTTVDENTAQYFEDTSATFVNGIGRGVFPSDQKMRNYAGFANLEFDVTDRLTLKGGVRRTHAERSIVTQSHDDPDFPLPINPFTGNSTLSLTDFFNAVYGAIYHGAVPPITPNGNTALDTRTDANGVPVNPATYLTTKTIVDQLKENNTSWSAGVDYKVSPTTLLYVNVSKGYKAGSFPHISGSIYTAYGSVKQESLIDYEAGAKLQLFDRKVNLNLAGFYYDYRNKQLRAKFVDPIFGALDLLANVPKSRIYGAEFSIDARPMRGLSLSASATYLNATVRDYTGVIGSTVSPEGLLQPVSRSFEGVRLPFSPKFQYAVRADYDFPLGSRLNGFVGAGVNGQSRSIGTLAFPGAASFNVPTSLYTINARALVDGQIGLHASDNAWRLTIWGKNIFNKYYWTNAIQAYDDVVRYAGRPAEYGATLAFRF